MRITEKLPLAIMTAALISCATTDTNPGLPPSDYRQVLHSYINGNFFDPYSMRDVAISEPVAGKMYSVYGWIVCLQANAKNRMGGYVGLTKTAYLIKNDVITSETNSPFCGTVKLLPWPEMENHGGRAKSQSSDEWFNKQERAGNTYPLAVIFENPPYPIFFDGKRALRHNPSMTMLTALAGVIIGTAGLVLSVLNYFRDRPKVIVKLVWHNVVTDEHEAEKTSCEIIVANVGRRPIYISHAHLSYPDTPVVSLQIDSVAGAKLLVHWIKRLVQGSVRVWP
jgi:hypothetical protein